MLALRNSIILILVSAIVLTTLGSRAVYAQSNAGSLATPIALVVITIFIILVVAIKLRWLQISLVREPVSSEPVPQSEKAANGAQKPPLQENAEAMVGSTSEVVDQLQNELSQLSNSQNEALEELIKKRQNLSAALQGLTNLSRELPRQFEKIDSEVAAITQEVEFKREDIASSTQKLNTVAERLAEERLALFNSPAEPDQPLTKSAHKKCPSCGRDILSNDAFCDRCGATLRTCPSCARPVNPNESFCTRCGTPLG